MQQQPHSVRSTTRHPTVRSRRAAWPVFRDILPVALALCAAFSTASVQAQTAAELRNLIFDPVPLQRTQAADGSITLTELAPARPGTPVTLDTWLQANGGAETNPVDALDESIARYEASIVELESNEGPYSAQLPQQLLALGTALQNKGDLEAAQKHFDKAMHVTRVNHGLFSETQIPYIELSINNHLRQGNLFAADEQQRYLFYLNQKNHGHDSTALLPALEQFADWNIFAFTAPSIIPALSFSNEGAAAPPVDEATFRIQRLINAQNIYWSISQILLNNFGMSDPRLLDAEKSIAQTNYFFATSIAADAETVNFAASPLTATTINTGVPLAPAVGNMGYRQGRDALERRRNYMRDMQLPAAEQLQAALDQADWMLYFDRQRMKALDMYDDIREEFSALLPAEQLNAVLSPAYPQTLPSFIRPSWSRVTLGIPEDQPLAYKGYIDVEFSINRFGKTLQMQVLGRSDPDVKLVEQRLLRSLRRTQFRPRFEGEALRTGDTVQARYYYTW